MNTYDQSIIHCVVDRFHVQTSAKNSAINETLGKKIVCDKE